MVETLLRGVVEDTMNPDQQQIPEQQAEAYIIAHTVDANDLGSVCGDGRFTREQAKGKIRIFGGHEGVMAAIIGAQTVALDEGKITSELSVEQIYQKYSEVIKSIMGEDVVVEAHKDDLGHGEGCGFMGWAIRGAHDHFSSDKAQELRRLVLGGLEGHEEGLVVLEGGHKERDVYMVDDANYTVISRDGDEEHFVVDRSRAKNLIMEVVEFMGMDAALTTQNVWDELVLQMNKTAEILAGGMNIFGITYDQTGKPKANLEGTVPPAA